MTLRCALAAWLGVVDDGTDGIPRGKEAGIHQGRKVGSLELEDMDALASTTSTR